MQYLSAVTERIWRAGWADAPAADLPGPTQRPPADGTAAAAVRPDNGQAAGVGAPVPERAPLDGVAELRLLAPPASVSPARHSNYRFKHGAIGRLCTSVPAELELELQQAAAAATGGPASPASPARPEREHEALRADGMIAVSTSRRAALSRLRASRRPQRSLEHARSDVEGPAAVDALPAAGGLPPPPPPPRLTATSSVRVELSPLGFASAAEPAGGLGGNNSSCNGGGLFGAGRRRLRASGGAGHAASPQRRAYPGVQRAHSQPPQPAADSRPAPPPASSSPSSSLLRLVRASSSVDAPQHQQQQQQHQQQAASVAAGAPSSPHVVSTRRWRSEQATADCLGPAAASSATAAAAAAAPPSAAAAAGPAPSGGGGGLSRSASPSSSPARLRASAAQLQPPSAPAPTSYSPYANMQYYWSRDWTAHLRKTPQPEPAAAAGGASGGGASVEAADAAAAEADEAAASAADTDSADAAVSLTGRSARRRAAQQPQPHPQQPERGSSGGYGGYGGYSLPRLTTRRKPAVDPARGSADAADPAAEAHSDPASGGSADAATGGEQAQAQEPAAARGQAASAAVCDKCDSSKHDTAHCPHYPQERTDHPDARARPSKAQRNAASAIVMLSGASVAPQPGDGNCLFHSLAHGLADGSSAHVLRRQVVAFIEKNATTEISATPLHEWVRWDAGTSIAAYVRRMSSGGIWGGGIELAAFSIMRQVDVHVFEATREAGRFKRIGYFPCGADGPARRSIHVLYRGGAHYDALVGGVVTTTLPKEAAAGRAK